MWSTLIFLSAAVTTVYSQCTPNSRPIVCAPPFVYFEPLCTCLRPRPPNPTATTRPVIIAPGSRPNGGGVVNNGGGILTNGGGISVNGGGILTNGAGVGAIRPRPPVIVGGPAPGSGSGNPYSGRDPTIQLTGLQFVDSGDRMTLKCNATRGVNMPQDIKFLFILNEIEWFRNGARLATDMAGTTVTQYMDPMSDSVISKLTISKAGYGDAGTYICRMSDKLIDSLQVEVLFGQSTGNEVLKKSSTIVFLVSSLLSSLLHVGYKLLPESMGGQGA